MKIVPVIAIVLVWMYLGCSKDNTDNPITKIDIDVIYDTKNPRRSPEIHLKNVPEGVNHLQILFFDDSNKWEHGGGNLPYDGSGIIQAGAVKEFKGLSSLYGFPKIRVTVTAFLENGQVVGKGSITKKPPD
jgi:hypothetical protein